MQAALDLVDAVEDDPQAIADREAAPTVVADDLAGVLAIGVDVVEQAAEGNEPLDEEIGELDEEAVFGGVHHHRVEVFADAVLHELDLLPLHQLALGFGGTALVVATLFGDGAEVVFAEWRGFADGCVLVYTNFCFGTEIDMAGDTRFEQCLGDAVHNEVGVAADGRGEVGVVGSGEGEVAFVLLGVASLLERAQHEVGENSLLRLAGDLMCQPLIHFGCDRDVLRDFVRARC